MICEYCKQASTFQFKNGIFCCSKSVSSCPEIQRRKKETCRVKYGDEHFKNPTKGKLTKLQKYGDENYNNRDSAKNTILQIYGVDNISKVENIKNKKDQTFDKNYRKNPDAHAMLIKQKQETWKNLDKISINQKRANTCLEKYGVENPLQVTEIFEKTQKRRWKYFTFPSGSVKKIQGCEGLALTDLLKIYQELDIITERKDIPKIKYRYNNKNKIYYPDIFIISKNKIVEVKSDWTYTKDYEKNQAKKNACLDQGYNFEFWIYSKTGLQIL